MGWKGYEFAMPTGMFFRRMFCQGCGTKLKRHKVSKLLKKGEPDYYNNTLMSGWTVGMDKIQMSSCVYRCPTCEAITTYDEQLIIAKKQKKLGVKILSDKEN